MDNIGSKYFDGEKRPSGLDTMDNILPPREVEEAQMSAADREQLIKIDNESLRRRLSIVDDEIVKVR